MASTAEQSTSTVTSTSGTIAPGGHATLESDRGRTSINDSVVAKVVGIAAREVPGVHAMGRATSRAIGSVTQRVGLGDERVQGVSVEVGEREAAADLTIVVEYGESIPAVSGEVRENVIRRVEGVCGLDVKEVNIYVDDLHFAGDEEEQAAPAPSRVQ